MPRCHSRLTLDIRSIAIERLREVTDLSIWSEGAVDACAKPATSGGPLRFSSVFTGALHDDLRALFSEGWDRINGRREGCSWANKPWVWRIEFRRETP